MSLLNYRAQNWTHLFRCVSQGLSREEGAPPMICYPCTAQNFMKFLSVHFSIPPSFFLNGVTTWCINQSFLLCTFCKFVWVALGPIIHLMKLCWPLLDRGIDPGVTALMTELDFVLLITSLQSWKFSLFSTLIVHLPIPFISLTVRITWKTVPNLYWSQDKQYQLVSCYPFS